MIQVCGRVLVSPRAGEEVKVRGQQFFWVLEALGDKTQLAHFKYYFAQIYPHSINIQPLFSQLWFFILFLYDTTT